MPRREPDKTLDSTDAIGERGEEIRGGEPPTGILGDDIIYNTNNIIKHNAAQASGTAQASKLLRESLAPQAFDIKHLI